MYRRAHQLAPIPHVRRLKRVGFGNRYPWPCGVVTNGAPMASISLPTFSSWPRHPAPTTTRGRCAASRWRATHSSKSRLGAGRGWTSVRLPVEGGADAAAARAVHGDDDQHRARIGRIECCFGGGPHLGGGAGGVRDSNDGPGYAAQHALDADAGDSGVLKQLLSGGRPGNVAADDDEGCAFAVRRDHTGHDVGGSRSRGDDDTRHATACAIEAHGREDGGRFVSRFDELRALAAGKNRVEYGNDRTPGYSEESIDTHRTQLLDYRFGGRPRRPGNRNGRTRRERDRRHLSGGRSTGAKR